LKKYNIPANTIEGYLFPETYTIPLEYSTEKIIEMMIKRFYKNLSSIEESKDLTKVIDKNNTYLVDCVSMWLFNNLENCEESLKQQLQEICKIDANIIFILNDVSCGVITMDKESRRFVDFSGLIGQELAQLCDEVYEVKYGIERRLK
jgi:adenosylcobinamide kinase/adenosylcobinamide-phosphate guanylyltransferase